jgi:hypothetical protein
MSEELKPPEINDIDCAIAYNAGLKAGAVEIHRLMNIIKQQSEEIDRLKKPAPMTSVGRWVQYDATVGDLKISGLWAYLPEPPEGVG